MIFENTSVHIPDNKLSVILGPNGAGKSTLLKIITGNINADCKIENTFKNIFYLPQNPYYPKGITTFDYLSSIFFKNNWKWFLNDEEKNQIQSVLEKIGLPDKKNINIENLSGGEIQKVNIDNEHKVIQKEKNEFFEIQNLKQIFNMDFEIINNRENLYVQVVD